MGLEIIFFAIAASVCWAFGDFFIQKCVRKVGDIETLLYIGIVGSIVLFPFVLPEFNLLFEPSNLLILLLLGVITFVAALFDFEALKKGKLAVIEILVELELPFTIVAGYLLFNELASTYQFLLIIPIFVGIILVSINTEKMKKIKLNHLFEKGALLAVIAAIGMAGINTFTALSAREISPLFAVWAPWVVFSVLCLAVIIQKGEIKKLITNTRKNFKLALATGIADTTAWIFLAFALASANLGVITAITECYPVLGLGLAIFINKEKIQLHQYLGALLTIVGAVLLSMTLN
jgi:drug/metabolite transporter (DMT)-like permease